MEEAALLRNHKGAKQHVQPVKMCLILYFSQNKTSNPSFLQFDCIFALVQSYRRTLTYGVHSHLVYTSGLTIHILLQEVQLRGKNI